MPVFRPPEPLHLSGETPTPSWDRAAPIALFDSGVGGLTVLQALAQLLPAERFFYIADQVHVPYGGRPLDEIRGFARGLTRHAFARGAKAVVMACNVSSATYAAEAAISYGEDRVLGVVEPGAQAAAQATRTGRIGVLATAGTVASGAYPEALARARAQLEVRSVACPRFVPLIEAGKLDGPEAEDAVQEAVAPLLDWADTLVLGCTHYPFLLPLLRRLAPDLKTIDPAEATARVVAAQLGDRAARLEGAAPEHVLHTTGNPEVLEAQAASMLESSTRWTVGPRLVWPLSRAA
ncbi:MAG: glutamate racemase [Myxococcota bacterium]